MDDETIVEKFVGLLRRVLGGKETVIEPFANGGFLVDDETGQHLPTMKDGKVDHGLMGAAWAALHGGYRGNKYEGPGKDAAIAKLKKMYASENMQMPSEMASADGGTDMEKAEVEKFEAEKKDLAEKLSAETAKREKLEADIASEKLSARKAALKVEAESFKALSLKPDEFADKVANMAPEVADWLRGVLKAADEAAKPITKEIGKDTEAGSGAEKFLAVVDGIRKADPKLGYGDALKQAEALHPDLARAYTEGG